MTETNRAACVESGSEQHRFQPMLGDVGRWARCGGEPLFDTVLGGKREVAMLATDQRLDPADHGDLPERCRHRPQGAVIDPACSRQDFHSSRRDHMGLRSGVQTGAGLDDLVGDTESAQQDRCSEAHGTCADDEDVHMRRTHEALQSFRADSTAERYLATFASLMSLT